MLIHLYYSSHLWIRCNPLILHDIFRGQGWATFWEEHKLPTAIHVTFDNWLFFLSHEVKTPSPLGAFRVASLLTWLENCFCCLTVPQISLCASKAGGCTQRELRTFSHRPRCVLHNGTCENKTRPWQPQWKVLSAAAVWWCASREEEAKLRFYQFFSVRMVCDSWERGMASIWLRSFETMVEKAGCPLYPGSREKRGYVPDPKHHTKISTRVLQYTNGQLSFVLPTLVSVSSPSFSCTGRRNMLTSVAR